MARQKEETLDWVNVIVPEAKKQLEIYLAREGHKPTLRSLYYILLTLGVPGTEYGYKKLSASIVAAKKAGTFPEDAFTDITRVTAANFRTLDRYVTPEWFVSDHVDDLRNADSYYKIPRWFRQSHYVIDWIEKGTMLSIFETILQTADPPRDVPVAVNRGNSGYQTFTDRCDEIVRLVRKITTDPAYGYDDNLVAQPIIIIHYFGDLDPSGENMSVFLTRYLKDRPSLEDLDIRLERVGINLDQVVRYDLQIAPQDIDTMQKLWADSNIAKFSKNLRTSPYYKSWVKPRLGGNPEYLRLKAQIINHPKTIEQLKRRAGENKKKGLIADPEKYARLRAEESEK